MSGGGMAVVAMTGLDSKVTKASSERASEKMVLPEIRDGLVEITALSEERSLEAASILQERHIASRPLQAYAKVCRQVASDAPNDRTRLKKKGEDMNPLMRILVRKMPILTWAREMTVRTLKADLVAGLTVGVMVIPQSMSYGKIAGLPYINGMYSACVPTIVYALLGQSRQLAVGPVAMVSLLVEAGLRGQLSEQDCPEWYAQASPPPQYEVCEAQYVNLACLTAAVVGLMQVVGSILKLGFLVSFLGHPVVSGFTSGAAIIIGLSQTKYLLGYDIPKSQYIYDTVANIVNGLDEFNGMTFLLGSLFLIYLVVNKKVAQTFPKLKMLGPVGPLLTCLVGTLLVWLVPALREDFHVQYVGVIPDGIMPVSLGGFRFEDIQKVLPTAFSACLIGYMESIAIGKNLASKHGYEIDAGQEMLALGVSNLFGSAFSCYPVTGSFSRSAVNNSTGALTQFSGVVTAVIMVCTLLFLTPLFQFLPKFVLAAIVLNSVIPLVAIGEARTLWRVKRLDFVLWVVAFLGTLFLGVLMGIIVAVLVSLTIVIYESVRPQLTILWRIPGTTIYRNMKQESSGTFIPNMFVCRIGSSLYFANAQYVKDMLLAYVSDLEDINPTEYLILEMTPVISVDSTACHVIQDIVQDFRSRGIEVAFAMVGNRVDKTMRKAGLKKFMGERWFFPNVHEAVVFCLRHQHAKRKGPASVGTSKAGEDVSPLDPDDVNVGFRSEVGFSNEMHSDDTMVFITLARDLPGFMSEVTRMFKKSNISVIRAQVEPLSDEGAKHTYFLRSLKTGTKLNEKEFDRLRANLEALVHDGQAPERGISLLSRRSWSGEFGDCAKTGNERIAILERQLHDLKDIMLNGPHNDPNGSAGPEDPDAGVSAGWARQQPNRQPKPWMYGASRLCCAGMV